jgi:nitrous oxide reductase accessory protein NosL
MASKVVLVALVFLALVAGAAAASESGHAVPLHRAERSLGWMNGMKGGPPSGMQPSVTTVTIPERPTMIGN